MSNRHYIKGRNFEYKVRNQWTDLGYLTIRSAGSKSPIDLVAIPNGIPQRRVNVIQCKVVQTRRDFERLKKAFKANPPINQPTEVVQVLSVWIGDEGTQEDTWL
jgi:hypothetical protein